MLGVVALILETGLHATRRKVFFDFLRAMTVLAATIRILVAHA